MRIKRILYPVKTLGPGNRVGIWLTGCSHNCNGCMTPELQSKCSGNHITVGNMMDAIANINTPIDGFTISGGEPFDQYEQLCELIKAINSRYGDDIIIYTGYYLSEIEELFPDVNTKIYSLISVVVDGRYIDELNDGIGLRGSSNQTVNIFKNHERFSYMTNCDRSLQLFNCNTDNILTVGIL